MKRRNADCGKIRRPMKRTKIAESIYGSTFLYLKFMLIWAFVLMADFILEFRFEYLWPFWLLLRSVYDSYKYQGLAFSIFFVFIALTSDMICFLFIPVQWLFFAASTYVWVQYVWYTERGICLPSISLWLLFVYIEASVRLKELKHFPFHLDLCRPFAAHCIGYPVVTLGFGCKSYIGYTLKLRKQKEVAKENTFYIQLLQQALPAEPSSLTSEKGSKNDEEVISNGVGHCSLSQTNGKNSNINGTPPGKGVIGVGSIHCHNSSAINRYSELDPHDVKKHNNNPSVIEKHEYQYMETHLSKRVNNVNHFDENDESCEQDKISKTSSLTIASRNSKWVVQSSVSNINISSSGNGRKKNITNRELTSNILNIAKDEHTVRLESDIKRLKTDLEASRQCEQELRAQVNSLTITEHSFREELSQLQQHNKNLQNKLHNLVTARQQDKQLISQLEKRLQEERKLRNSIESTLASERKAKKAEEAAAARAVLVAAANRTDCTENCKNRRRDLENDVKQLRREVKVREDQLRQIEREVQSLRQYKDNQNDTEVLMSALSAMQDKNTHLENSLSAETRIKLDLFCALGEAKRQVEITQSLLTQKEKEIEELKSKVAEVMAVMPPTSTYAVVSLESDMVSSSMLYSPKFMSEDKGTTSSLDPNASIYTPNIGSSEM
ncbi:macoilin-like isoform X3 [Tachypleus tridentatus]|uniref:macoilin-like isoform X3 n=1 Tax=Tachypleus tridentatus TaxID=6853 RepID=UPI003FD145EB